MERLTSSSTSTASPRSATGTDSAAASGVAAVAMVVVSRVFKWGCGIFQTPNPVVAFVCGAL